MNKKLTSLVLSGLIVLNSSVSLKNIYADSDTKPNKLIKNEDTKSTQVVYLQNGEGDEGVGDGTKNKPYQNIRTALKNIQNGGTLKLIGTVMYAKYEEDSSGAALPLEIDKSITIEGESGAELSIRGSIQLKGDVTFKNLNLEITPEVVLGRSTRKSSDAILGQVVERSATIYVNGHTLTLDNISTKAGNNEERPYISGGSYRETTTPTGKSVINIINSNDETKFFGIYAGDYYKDINLNVDINIDGKADIKDNKIYTGGYNNNLNGNVNITLNGYSSVTKFDKANHNGNVDVTLNEDAYITDFDAKNINNLTLKENSGIVLSKNATFDVNNVTLNNNAKIDFRGMDNNTPTVKSNFDGETNVDDSRKGGTIFLNNEQTLDIKGNLSGTNRLNNRGTEPVDMFVDNHVYVKTSKNSSGTLTIEDSMFDNYKLTPVESNNCKNWTVNRLEQGFGDFRWIDEDSRIIPRKGSTYAQGSYSIAFIDDEGKEYIPDDLFTDFEYTLTKVDKSGNKEEVIQLNTEDNTGIDRDGNIEFYLSQDDEGNPKIVVLINHINNFNNDKMILNVTHKKTQKSISKNIYVFKDEKHLSGNVSIEGSPIEGNTISADISSLPKDIEDVKYKWYVKDQGGDYTLVQNQTGKDFVLSDGYAGKTIKVEVEAMNYLDKVSSNEVVVKSKSVAPVINGIKNIEVKAGDVDKFNSGENLTGITGADCHGNKLSVKVTGKVEKPAAGTNKVYEIKYSVTDDDGNTTEKTREVTVTNQNPTISGLTDIIITQGDTYDVQTGVTANDHEDGVINNISYPNDDLTKLGLGLHNIVYSVTDSDGNIVKNNRRVIILEKTNLPDVDDTLNPEQSIINDISKIEGINVQSGDATKGNPISVKVDTLTGLNELFNYYTNKNFKVSSVEKPKEDGDLLIYLIKITKNSNKRAEESYFMEIKVDKNNKEVIEKVERELNNTTNQEDSKVNINDIKGHWAENNILNFVKQGYINGYTDGTFKPDNSITRAEFIKITNKVFGYNDKGTENFNDVNPGDWYYNDVCIAVKSGYINGKTLTTFEPNSPITRQEVAKILTTIMNNKNTDYDKLSKFKDGNKVDNWAKPYVEGALDAGYLSGDDKGNLNPTKNITRAEAVTVLIRVKK